MQVKSYIQRYELQHQSHLINSKQPYQSFYLLSTNNINNSAVQPNVLILTFHVCLLQTLNFALKPKATLFKLWINNFSIDVSLQTSQNQFSIDHLAYESSIKVETNKKKEFCWVVIEDIKSEFRKTSVKARVLIHRDGSTLSEVVNNKSIVVEMGNQKPGLVIACQIMELSLETCYFEQKLSHQSFQQNRFTFSNTEYSQPIMLFSSLTELYRIFGVKSKTEIYQLVANLADYSSVVPRKEKKLYICHDMKGGYCEDVNFINNYAPSNKQANVFYRSFHLEQAEVFNYFSHYNITVPTIHWRKLCRKYEVVCLGTYIIEKSLDETLITSEQLALFLVYVARKCQFDGYLINIEVNISQIEKLKGWLGLLTAKIHEYIPNSLIIWYDSITGSTGEVRYQNELNNTNSIFYKLTDGFFTNYWWNQQSLVTTIKTKNSLGASKKVYIGNDCFGRNTYGGGKYDIYKAVNKILQYKNDLDIALFAPGFTYQDNGQDNRILYHINQNQMYKGLRTQIVPIQKWVNVINGGNGWKKEGDWAVTSFQVCQRTFIKEIPSKTHLKAKFICQVLGTAPNFADPYKITMQVVDVLTGAILLQPQLTQWKEAKENIQLLVMEIEIDPTKFVQNLSLAVKIVEMGRDKEGWGGHFGVRFRRQTLYLTVYQKQENWAANIAVSAIPINCNLNSFMNVGYGDNFYWKGFGYQKGYNYLCDMDILHTYIINHPFDTQLYFYDAFAGGSCLKVNKPNLKLLRSVIPVDIDLNGRYYIQLLAKNTSSLNLVVKYISKQAKDRVFCIQKIGQQSIGTWVKYNFMFKQTVEFTQKILRCLLQINSNQYPYLLGGVKLVNDLAEKKEQVECTIQISKANLPIDQYFVNFIVKCKSHNRLLVKIESFCGFCYMNDGWGYLGNIGVNKNDGLMVQMYDTQTGLEDILVKEKYLEGSILAKLIFDGTFTF